MYVLYYYVYYLYFIIILHFITYISCLVYIKIRLIYNIGSIEKTILHVCTFVYFSVALASKLVESAKKILCKK